MYVIYAYTADREGSLKIKKKYTKFVLLPA